jgi:hypothetical protein
VTVTPTHNTPLSISIRQHPFFGHPLFPVAMVSKRIFQTMISMGLLYLPRHRQRKIMWKTQCDQTEIQIHLPRGKVRHPCQIVYIYTIKKIHIIKFMMKQNNKFYELAKKII